MRSADLGIEQTGFHGDRGASVAPNQPSSTVSLLMLENKARSAVDPLHGLFRFLSDHHGMMFQPAIHAYQDDLSRLQTTIVKNVQWGPCP